jgi:protein-S-isoprenylcysteine O-methyltransferase Ste14
MKKHEPLSSAKAVLAILILAIAFVIFYKFMANQAYFTSDPSLLRSYVVFAIIAMGLLISLLYLANQTTHTAARKTVKAHIKSKTVKAVKSKKKKK